MATSRKLLAASKRPRSRRRQTRSRARQGKPGPARRKPHEWSPARSMDSRSGAAALGFSPQIFCRFVDRISAGAGVVAAGLQVSAGQSGPRWAATGRNGRSNRPFAPSCNGRERSADGRPVHMVTVHRPDSTDDPHRAPIRCSHQGRPQPGRRPRRYALIHRITTGTGNP